MAPHSSHLNDNYSLGTTSSKMKYPVLRWHCAFVDTVWLSEHVAVIQLNGIKNSVFAIEKTCVFLEVAVFTELLIITSV